MKYCHQDKWKKIRQWKYCPTCKEKMKEECRICRQKICLLCDLELIWDANYGTIHEKCQIEATKQLQEINIETIKGLSYSDRMKILTIRNDWLKRQRKQDKKEVSNRRARIYRKTKVAFWKEQGLCPYCKEHDIIFKGGRCLKCYGTHIKRMREEGAERKRLHQIKKEKERRQRKRRKR
jgi:hypothetical protein